MISLFSRSLPIMTSNIRRFSKQMSYQVYKNLVCVLLGHYLSFPIFQLFELIKIKVVEIISKGETDFCSIAVKMLIE